MASICREEKITFINVFDPLDVNKDFEDGLHLNSERHRKVFERVKEGLVKNKVI